MKTKAVTNKDGSKHIIATEDFYAFKVSSNSCRTRGKAKKEVRRSGEPA